MKKSIALAVLSLVYFVVHGVANSADAQAGKAAKTAKDTPVRQKVADLKVLTFESAGHKIRSEWFYPPGGVPGACKVLIVMHGSGGLDTTGGFFRDVAKEVAASGTIVVVLHYMDRQNITWANNAQMSSYFQQWLQTLHDAVDFVAAQPNVDANRISLMGHSLGAQLCFHEAASDARIHSIVDMAGCFVLPTAKITRMPKVLILQGNADKVVTLKREGAMVAVLKRCHTTYYEHIFPGVDHMFDHVEAATLVHLIVDFLRE